MNNKIGKFILVLTTVMFYSCTSLKNTKEAEYSLLRGINLCNQGDLEGALKEYTTSYEIAPENTVLLKEMAFVYYNFENYGKAEEFWKKALELSPKDDEVIKNMTTMYYQKGEFQKALEMIKTSYNPNSDYFLQIKGLIEYQNKNYEKACDYLNKIDKRNMDENTYRVYLDIINKLYDNERYYSELEKGKTLFNGQKEYTLLYAKEITERFKNFNEAEQALLGYLITKGNDNDILKILSWVYEQSGDIEKSKDTLELLESGKLPA